MAIILIVDDRAANRDYLATLLRYGGHRLVEAADGEAALAAARADPPDLVIADIVMPTMDGYELARQIRADPVLAAAKIIFFTSSYVVAETRRLAEAVGVAHIIAKPAEPAAILAVVDAALAAVPLPPRPPAPEEFRREHMRLLTDTLAKKVDELEAEMAEREQAEAALRASEKRFRALIENSSDAISLLGPDGRLTYASPATTRILGYTPEETLGTDPVSIVHPDDLPELLSLLGGVIENPAHSVATRYRVRHRDGRWRWIDTTIRNLLAEPAVAALVFNYRDVTDRVNAQAQLRLQGAALNVAANAIAITDRAGVILWVNPAFTALTGYPAEEVVGKSTRLLKSGEQPPEFYRRMWTTIAAGEVWHGELVNRRKDGRLYTQEQTITPLRDGHGQITHYIAIQLDVTERVQREREVAAMAAVSTALRAATTQAEMATIILAQVTTLLEAGAASLSLRDERTGELVVIEGRGEMAEQAGHRLPPGVGIGGQVTASRRPYVSADVRADPHFVSLNSLKTASAVACVPLLTGAGVLGVLWAGRAAPFTDLEVRVLTAIADIAAGALQRAGLHEQTEARLRKLAALRQIDDAIMNSLDLKTTLVILLSQVTAQLGVDACDVLLLNHNLNVLEYAAGRGFRTALIEQSRVRVGLGHAGQAALERRLVAVPDLQADPARFARHGLLLDESFAALYCLPLAVKGRVVGVLEVWHRSALNPDADWLAYLDTLAGQAAIAVADARLFGDLQRSNTELRLAYDTTLEGWSAALDLRDRDTEGHSQRVTELATRLARALGVSGSALEHLRRGALLHDIGKMGIPDSILHKPGPLTDAEMAIMRQHPQFAYQLLSPIHFLQPALDIPYCHHEWWDGRGYPRGLKGDTIPLAARIFAVVDVWDALCSDRPYRRAWPADRVRAYLAEHAGTQFDPEVVQAFLALPVR